MEDSVIQQLALQFSMLSAEQSMWWMDTGGVMRQLVPTSMQSEEYEGRSMDTGGVMREIYAISTHHEEQCLCAYIKREYGGGYVALDNAELESFGVVEFLKVLN